jgi:hypothetical protein
MPKLKVALPPSVATWSLGWLAMKNGSSARTAALELNTIASAITKPTLDTLQKNFFKQNLIITFTLWLF